MIISRNEIASAVNAYRAWEPNVLAFRSRRGRILKPTALSWELAAYEALPNVRTGLVLDLRGRIVAGRYFVPAELIVEKLLGRLLIDRIAV